MVVGFDKFKEYFESFHDEFIIIGGTAVQMVCGEGNDSNVLIKVQDLLLSAITSQPSSLHRVM